MPTREVDAPTSNHAGQKVLLSLRGVGKSFAQNKVLHDVSFDVMQNEFLTIIGPSGSGKTTILRLIGGFDDITNGSVLLDGKDILPMPINRRPFNTVFQDYALFPHMSVAQNVGYGLRVRRVARSEIEARVARVLDIIGLSQLRERLPSELSGGQRQRVALARAIILEPRLVLLDEPLAALDVELRGQMRRFLKGLQRQIGITFVFITHDQEEAITLSDRVVVMRNGRIEQIGNPETIYYRPATRFVASFFGENNLIDGRLTGRLDGLTMIESAMGTLYCDEVGEGFAIGAKVCAAIRPESLIIGAAAHDAENYCNSIIIDVQFAGSLVMIQAIVEHTGQVLRLRMSSSHVQRPAVGDKLPMGWWARDAAIVAGGEAL